MSFAAVGESECVDVHGYADVETSCRMSVAGRSSEIGDATSSGSRWVSASARSSDRRNSGTTLGARSNRARGGVQAIGDLVELVGEQVSVEVERHRRGLVSEHPLYDLYIGARRNRQ